MLPIMSSLTQSSLSTAKSDNILKGMNFPELEQKYAVKNQQSFQH